MEILPFPSETCLSERDSALLSVGEAVPQDCTTVMGTPLNHVVCAGHLYHTAGRANRGRLWSGTSSYSICLKCLTTENSICHSACCRGWGVFWQWCAVITGYRVGTRLDCRAHSVWEMMLLLIWKREAALVESVNPPGTWQCSTLAVPGLLSPKGEKILENAEESLFLARPAPNTVLLLPALLLSVEAMWITDIRCPLLVSNVLGQIPC